MEWFHLNHSQKGRKKMNQKIIMIKVTKIQKVLKIIQKIIQKTILIIIVI